MPIQSSIDAITNKTLPLQMYTTPSSSPEEKSNVFEHAEISGLVHGANDKKARTLVLAGLGREPATFKSTKELLCVFADVADAHQGALDKANILHRDVSAGNILITDEGRGILVDWDVAKYVDDVTMGVGQPERTGTFQFLSARFVSNMFDFGPHDRLDDMESLFHVLQWIVLRSIDHEMHPIALGGTLYDIFSATFPGRNGLVVCHGRLNSIRESIWVACDNFQGVLRVLLEELRKTINSRYVPAVVMDSAKEIYTGYRTLQQQLHSYPMPDKPEYSDGVRSMRNAAMPAILYEQLEDANWFRERLREAADQCDLNQPAGDTGTPQKDNPVQTGGVKKTNFEINLKNSAIDFYDQSQDIANSVHDSKNRCEADDPMDDNL